MMLFFKTNHQCIYFIILCTTSTQADIVDDNCECVPFYLCNNGTINTSGAGIIDIRIKDSQECSSYLDYCCQKKDLVRLSSAIRDFRPPQKDGCGYRNPKGVGYEITGNNNNETQFGEFPWMIAIFHKEQNTNKHFYKCGGSLIHPEVVLTAAHCVMGNGSFKIRAGEWDSQTKKEIYIHQDREVVSVEMHPRFSTRNLQNDAALLFLESPLDIVAHINVVCLPPHGALAISSKCFVSGWGKKLFDANDVYQTILKKICVPVVDKHQCQDNLRKTRLGQRFHLHRSLMCAGGEEGQDSCKGDGGGPLVCPIAGEEERYQQVGIVSWGIGCGTKDVPAAYADVAYLRNWIDRTLTTKNIRISDYQY